MMILLLGMVAQATCWESERVRPVRADCSDLTVESAESSTVRAGELIWLLPETGSCCSPPGGPSSCHFSPVDLTSTYPEPGTLGVTRIEDGVSIALMTRSTILPCAGKTVFTTEITAPGSYWLGGGAVEVTP